MFFFFFFFQFFGPTHDVPELNSHLNQAATPPSMICLLMRAAPRGGHEVAPQTTPRRLRGLTALQLSRPSGLGPHRGKARARLALGPSRSRDAEELTILKFVCPFMATSTLDTSDGLFLVRPAAHRSAI